MSNCKLCPRDCRADRENGRRGFCGVTGKTIKCARAALHMWEEPCISGDTGSGAVFFSGCPLRCVYCQNRDIAGADRGIDVTEERLSEIFLELQAKGAANINLVTPTHYTPQIIRSVQRARENGLKLPIIYNVKEEYLAAVFETVKKTYGSMEKFFQTVFYLKPKMIEEFRNKYLI